jgi:hypothetical protein
LFIQLDTNKYPDGLYIKDDKVTTVMAHPIINASGTLLGINQFFFLFDHNQSNLSIGVVEFYRVDSTIPFSDEDEEVS